MYADLLLLLTVAWERWGYWAERVFWTLMFYVCCLTVAYLALTHA